LLSALTTNIFLRKLAAIDATSGFALCFVGQHHSLQDLYFTSYKFERAGWRLSKLAATVDAVPGNDGLKAAA
jgi:hypothetical protein